MAAKGLLSASIGKFTLLDYQSHRLHRVWLSAFSRSAEALWANNVPMCPGLFEPRGGDRCQGRVLLVDSDRPSSGAARTSEISDEGRMERLLPCGRFPSLRDYVRLAFCAANHPAEGPNFGPRWTLRGLGFRLASSSVLGSFACTARASATVVVALRDPTAAMKWATRHRHGGCNAKDGPESEEGVQGTCDSRCSWKPWLQSSSFGVACVGRPPRRKGAFHCPLLARCFCSATVP